MPTYLIPDILCDPFPGLSHPSTTALVLERLGTLGFSILYEITGQIVSDSGEALDGLEEELFDGFLELFLTVLVPRLSAVHRQLCVEEKYRLENKHSQRHKRDTKKRQKKTSHPHAATTDNEIPGVSAHMTTSGGEEEKKCNVMKEGSPHTVSDDLENHVVYLSSFGTLPLPTLLKRGGILYPHEWRLSTTGGRVEGRGGKRNTIQMSLLRHVTSILNSEILGLWHSVDQMISLLLSPVDDGDRLALLFRSWYLWMIIDDATLTPCHTIKMINCHPMNATNKGRKTILRNRTLFGIQQHSEWNLIAASLSLSPLAYHHLYSDLNEVIFFQHGPDSCLRYFTSGLHIYKNPPLVQALLISQQKSISNLLDSMEDNESLHSHLYFLMRTPWVMTNSQRLEYVITTIEEREEYREQHGPSSSSSSTGYEIHLNRFTSPLIWGEAILQQLLLEKYRSMKSTSLSILYQGEAGIGHGPIKEFLDICRIFLTPRVISSDSLIDIVETTLPGTHGEEDGGGGKELVTSTQPEDDFQMSETIFDQLKESGDNLPLENLSQTLGSAADVTPIVATLSDSVSDDTNKKRPKSRKGKQFMDIPLVSIFPLFRPAGPSYPDCVVPIEMEVIVNKILNLSPIAAQHSKTHPPNQQDEMKGKQGKGKRNHRHHQSSNHETPSGGVDASSSSPPDGYSDALVLAKRIFECLGVIIGFCLVYSSPIGHSFPPYIWMKILSHSPSSDSSPSSSHDESRVTWETYCGSDERLHKSCHQILHELSSEELLALELPFLGQRYSWDENKQQLLLIEDVELLSSPTPTATASSVSSTTMVQASNKVKYINLFTKSRALTSGMLSSIHSIRTGLLRIISQDLLNILNPTHLSAYLQGDKEMNLLLLQQHVTYRSGYHPSHRVIKLFWHLIKNDFDEEERRKLLLFWTGSSVPSKGGYGVDEGDNDEVSLTPAPFNSHLLDSLPISQSLQMTIARKPFSHHGWLPEAQTCEKKLYLPEYRTYDEVTSPPLLSLSDTLFLTLPLSVDEKSYQECLAVGVHWVRSSVECRSPRSRRFSP
jgi:hypothetical protein